MRTLELVKEGSGFSVQRSGYQGSRPTYIVRLPSGGAAEGVTPDDGYQPTAQGALELAMTWIRRQGYGNDQAPTDRLGHSFGRTVQESNGGKIGNR